MANAARTVIRTYLVLTLFTTLAASFIWGINTLFLLDAGLDNTQAFTVNAFFTVGQVLFEVPTGVVADTRGRRFSFLLGAATLLAATLLYLVMWQVRAGLLGWAIASILLGLGFTFFSGATEAWLVDALRPRASRARSSRSSPGPRSSTGVGDARPARCSAASSPRRRTSACRTCIRAALLGVTFVIALRFMHDIGFTPSARRQRRSRDPGRRSAGRSTAASRNPPVRWLMLAAPFTAGVGIFAFYALQPYLLQLYGDPTAYGVAGPGGRRSSPAPRSRAGSSCRGCGACSAGGRMR